MAWPKCNSTLENEVVHEIPVWHDWTFHLLGLWVSAIFGLIAIVISFLLIGLHAKHYSKPGEQRHIIRILFMVPVYAAVSFLSYKYYKHSVYFEVLRDCYEAFAIASFFSLLCNYIAPDLHQQKNYFRSITPKNWIWPMKWLQKCCGGPLGPWRTPRSGLTWFNVIWTGVFQYCFIRVFMTCVAVATQAFNRYCLESLNPAFSHVWVMVIEAGAVTIAMYCLIQFYWQLKGDIAEHKPLLKIVAIKLVIFLSFWQTIILSFLTSAGAIKATRRLETPDIKVGIPSMLLCIEMAFFAFFHLFAFSHKPYKVSSKQYLSEVPPGDDSRQEYRGGFLGVNAIIDAMNPWDMIKAVARSGKWLFRDRKYRENDSSYAVSRTGTNMDAFEPHQQGQKFSSLGHEATAYKGAGISPIPKQQPFGQDHADEQANLLAHAQTFGGARPDGAHMEHSPYRSDNGRGNGYGADIGVAQTKDYADQDWSQRHPPTYASQPEYMQGNMRPTFSSRQEDASAPYFQPPPVDFERGRQGR